MKLIGRLLPFAFALLVWRAASAEDIDIFTASPSVSASAPNVLIVVDNSVNWEATFSDTVGDCASTDPTLENRTNKKYCHVIGALKWAVGNVANVRVGLMLFAQSGDNGGYMRFGIRDMNTTNKSAFINVIDNLRASQSGPEDRDSAASNQPYGKAMFEAFKYFGGHTSPAAVSASACGGSPCAGSPVDSTHFGPSILAGGVGSTPSDKRDWPGNTGTDNATNRAINSAARWGAPRIDLCSSMWATISPIWSGG
jgi:type IV pilus assembly protein PilY1